MARPILLALALLLPLAGAATAGTAITVAADQARMISIPGEPGTVVVGNPNIADVTIQGTNAFILGRNYGSTNVIFLDRDGNQIAALDVLVGNESYQEVNIFKAARKYSYTCTGRCEAEQGLESFHCKRVKPE